MLENQTIQGIVDIEAGRNQPVEDGPYAADNPVLLTMDQKAKDTCDVLSLGLSDSPCRDIIEDQEICLQRSCQHDGVGLAPTDQPSQAVRARSIGDLPPQDPFCMTDFLAPRSVPPFRTPSS